MTEVQVKPPATQQPISRGSVTVSFGTYPSLRIPPEVKSEVVGAKLQIGQVVSRIDPIYPEDAERQGIEGIVNLRAVIGTDGSVKGLEGISGPPLLVPAAASAVRQWRYQPTLLSDQPIETARDVTIVFRLSSNAASANWRRLWLARSSERSTGWGATQGKIERRRQIQSAVLWIECGTSDESTGSWSGEMKTSRGFSAGDVRNLNLLGLVRRSLRRKPLTPRRSGEKAPAIELRDLNGDKMSLAGALKRGPVLVAFFKVNCVTSQFTFPFLQRIHEIYGGSNFSLWGISQNHAKDSRQFAANFNINFPVLIDGKGYPVSNRYGLANSPTLFLIQPDGRINLISAGFSKADLEAIAAEAARATRKPTIPLFHPDDAVPLYKPGWVARN
jgi:TonB family protein